MTWWQIVGAVIVGVCLIPIIQVVGAVLFEGVRRIWDRRL